MVRYPIPFVTALGAVAIVAAPIGAQTGKSGGKAVAADLVGSIAACRTITDDAARLACFDRSVAAFETARASNQVRIVDREDVRKARRSLFGLSLPRLNLFGNGGDDDEAEIKEIDAAVRTVREMPYGLWILVLDDGSQWQFTEQLTFPPKAGDAIHIKRGALGSYFGSVRKRPALKMKRIG